MNSNNQCLYTATCSTLLVDRRHHKEGGCDLHKIVIQDVDRCRDDATGTPPSITKTVKPENAQLYGSVFHFERRLQTSVLYLRKLEMTLKENSSRKRCAAFNLSMDTCRVTVDLHSKNSLFLKGPCRY
ncbi:hypothetical protein AVEN_138533-1 [Araneus ventricosus]|uniref:Uncharacterized protein n=1 Tax=Araneus ventricosus TaxID=182803 RepID=A0A4Y2GG41_ARAVE|nr:hypothetical protein AVEN_138533-1 [Araneus ventricosus]